MVTMTEVKRISEGCPSITNNATSESTSEHSNLVVKTASSIDDGTSQPPLRRLHHIPWPATKEEHQRWQLEHMAGAFRVFAKLGFADGGSGHISLRDPIDTDTFWINPYGVHFGLIKVSDLVQVDKLGNRVGGADMPINTAGFIIHSQIHEARPDINAACHMHSPYGRAWSTFGKPIEMLNQDSCMFYDDLAVYAGFGGVVLAAEEGQHIAQAMGLRHKNIILQNHGLLTAGGTVDEAAGFFIALERACQTQIIVENMMSSSRTHLTKTYVGEEEALYTKKNTGSPEVMYMQFKPEYDLVVKESKGDFSE